MLAMIIGFIVVAIISGIHYLMYLWLDMVGLFVPLLIIMILSTFWMIGDIAIRAWKAHLS